MMSPTVHEVMQELDAHRERFEAFCRSLSPAELELPVPGTTWLVRDFIAHLATIDDPIAEMFRAVRRGEDAGIRTGDGTRFDVDDWNERRVQERRHLPLQALLEEARATRSSLKRDLAALTEDNLQRTIRFAGDAKRPAADVPLGLYLRGWCKHDPIHVADMVRAVPHRGPELADWLDDAMVRRYQSAMNPGTAG